MIGAVLISLLNILTQVELSHCKQPVHFYLAGALPSKELLMKNSVVVNSNNNKHGDDNKTVKALRKEERAAEWDGYYFLSCIYLICLSAVT